MVYKKLVLMQVIFTIILGFVIYGNSLKGEFVWDDFGWIKDNSYIRSCKNIFLFFTRDMGLGSTEKSNFYRPLQMLTNMTDYCLWKLNPRGYHITNILLHISAALLIFWLTNVLFNNNPVSFLTSLLFLAHPVHTEAVSYISGRSESLSAAFMLLGIIFYTKYIKTSGVKFFLAALLSYLFALFSKENAVIFPLLILLINFVLKIKVRIKAVSPFFAVLFAYILYRLTVIGFAFSGGVAFPDLIKRVPGFFAAISEYLRILVLPLDLHLKFEDRLFSPMDHRAILGMSVSILLIILAAFKKENRLIFFSLGWFLITLLPVSNIFPASYPYMMEHWVYLPSLGILLLFASLIMYSAEHKFINNVVRFNFAAILLAFSFLTIKQNNYWGDPEKLYLRALKFAPDNWIFLNELALEYADKGKISDAFALFKKGLEINPHAINMYYNLGALYKKTGRYKEGVLLYKRLLVVHPKDINACYGLIDFYEALGDQAQAAGVYGRIEEINRGLAAEYFALGNRYSDKGYYQKAIGLYTKSLEFYPRSKETYSNLALAYISLGRFKEAITFSKKALELDSGLAVAYNNLAVAYYYEKDYASAIKYCDMAGDSGYKVAPKLLDSLKPFRKQTQN